MVEFLLTIPLFLALVALILGVLRSIVNAWFHHRLRLELLRKLEKHPELVHSPEDVSDLHRRLTTLPAASEPHDYVLTGVFLCTIGAACVIAGRIWRIGQIAAGVYWGGMGCILIGFVLALVGFLLRTAARQAMAKEPDRGDLV